RRAGVGGSRWTSRSKLPFSHHCQTTGIAFAATHTATAASPPHKRKFSSHRLILLLLRTLDLVIAIAASRARHKPGVTRRRHTHCYVPQGVRAVALLGMIADGVARPNVLRDA